MAMQGRLRWVCTKRTRLGYTMFWATCGSGRRTAGTRVIRALRPTGACGDRATVPCVCCAAAPGTADRSTSARPTASGTPPGAGAAAAGSVWPGQLIESYIFTSLPLARGSRGQRPLVAARDQLGVCGRNRPVTGTEAGGNASGPASFTMSTITPLPLTDVACTAGIAAARRLSAGPSAKATAEPCDR